MTPKTRRFLLRYSRGVRLMLAICLYLAALVKIAMIAGPLCILALVLTLPLALQGAEWLDPDGDAL